MKSIKFNKEVYKFLEEKLDIEKINYILDAAVYYAEQNGTAKARQLGQEINEAVVLASLKVAEIIKENFGEIQIKAKYFGGGQYTVNETAYCELV